MLFRSAHDAVQNVVGEHKDEQVEHRVGEEIREGTAKEAVLGLQGVEHRLRDLGADHGHDALEDGEEHHGEEDPGTRLPNQAEDVGHAGEEAAEELAEKYPDRKVMTVDTLSASAGFGLLLKLAVDKKNQGATIEEVAAYAESLVPKLAHWFTVEDLVYLKRGGRVSPMVALVGGVLSIKPVMHMDDEGHLIKVGTVRGRKASLKALADKLFETGDDPANGTIFISHGDCQEDVDTLCGMIKERGGNDVEIITNVGTVIGAHSGPGTMALFFVASQR